MKTDKPAKPPPRRWRRWLKRVLWTMLGLLVVLVIFHRPILRFAVDYGGLRFARGAGMNMTWEVGGSITGDVDIRNVKVTGDASAPLQKLTAARIRSDYSLWDLIKKGPGQFVTRASIEDGDLTLDPSKFPPAETDEEPGAPPKVILPNIDLKNMNVRIILPEGDLVLRGLNFTAQPGGTGVFEFEELQLPNRLPRLQNVKGTTETEFTQLTLKSLHLLPGMTVRELTVDLKDLEKSKLAFATAMDVPGAIITGSAPAGKVVLGGGVVTARGTLGLGKTASLDADATLRGITPETLKPWLQLPPGLNWNISELNATVSGDPGNPRKLKATLTGAGTAITVANVKADTVKLDATLENGVLTVTTLDLGAANGRILATATAQMPESWDAAGNLELKASADVNLPEVAALFTEKPPFTGALTGKLNATLANGSLVLAQADLRGSQWLVQGVPVEAVELVADTDGKRVKVDKVKVLLDQQNTVEAAGSLSFDGPQSLQVTWSVDLPNVERISKWIGNADTPGPDAGWLRGTGQVAGNIGDWQRSDFTKTTAATKLTAANVAWKSGRVESVSLDATLEAGRLALQNFAAELNERNRVTATGGGTLAAPWRFSAKVTGDLTQLADFEGWLKALDVPGPLAGKATIAWEGSGQAENFSLTGGGTVAVSDFKMAEMKEPASLLLKTSHTGKRAEIATLDAAMGDLKVSAPGTITDRLFEIPVIKITAGKLAPVEGHVRVPLNFDQQNGKAGPVSMTENLDVALTVKEWDLAEAVRAAGLKLGAKGKVNADVKLTGTVLNPAADVALNLKGVTMPDLKQKLAPTDANVKLNLRNRKLDATAEILQKPLQPLRAVADMPLDMEKLLQNPDALQNSPLNIRVNLPDSDLNAIKPFADPVASITGRFGVNANVAGTVGKPHVTGDLHAIAPSIIFKNDETPAIRNVNVRIRFDGTRVFIEEAGAMMSGGTLGARGTVDWTNSSNPQVDASFTAQQALVVRDDSISMRADGQIFCRGTLQQSTVTGRVELVRGRVFKEIEFLPLSLPNQLPPAPPPVTPVTSGAPSLPPPFDKWTFDVDIVTREPVRLLGNVLNGGAISTLKMTGTGAKPALEGKVSLQDARVRLPFSRLTVSRGEVIFSRDKPFEPILDLQGDAFVNGYQVTLNAYGPALDPKLRFSSSPPLPEGEIATLLATGSTSGDLKSGEGEAANRAAFLVLSRAYRKLFRKTALAKENDDPPRLTFSFSPLNSSSGNGRSFSAIYEINDHLQAVGSMSQRGSFRGLLYYLIRFR